MKVLIETLGCKVNYADSSQISSALAENGYILTDRADDADIIIINSCSVTHRAERECRQLVRRFHSQNPSSKIIITGCSVLSESFRKRIQEIPFVELIPTNELPLKFKISNKDPITFYYNRSRPFIKIQEGCDRFCSYCIVPFLRGHPKSIKKSDIISRINQTLKKGFKEIVIVGTHIMLYEDPETKSDIFSLLNDIENIDQDFRIRLSSMEPYGLSKQNIQLLSNFKKLCAHFHIPLQSGSDRVLKEMNREYTTSDFKNIVLEIKSRIPEATIGTDVITGFPTETVEDFDKTVKFIQSLPVDYLHVFRFSPREGTSAFHIKSIPSQIEIKNRAEILIKISFMKRREMLRKYIGSNMDTVIISNSGIISGLTHNYIKVIFQNCKPQKGWIYNAHLMKLNHDNTVLGELL